MPVNVRRITKDSLSHAVPHCRVDNERRSALMMKDGKLLGLNGDNERRTKKRFRIEQEVKYKMLYGQRIAETGVGKTMNISSGGVWFTTENTLTAGMPVELSMNWPVLLHDSCPMKLMIYGCVIRSSEKGAAVAIERYEFRTQGSKTFQQHQPGAAIVMELRYPN